MEIFFQQTNYNQDQLLEAMELRNKAIILGLTILVMVAAIYAIGKYTTSPSCEFILTKNMPKEHMSKIGHSDNNLALVAVSAYIQYADGTNVFQNGTDENRNNILLKFESYKLERIAEDKSKQTLKLDADCAKISFDIGKISNGFEVNSIEVSITVPNFGSYSCKVIDPIIPSSIAPKGQIYPPIKQIDGSHFKSNNGLPYRCQDQVKDKDGKSVKKDIVYIMFDWLEFEIYGDPKKTADNEFTHPAAKPNRTN